MASTERVEARLFGSAAVALRCPNYYRYWDQLERPEIDDIDVVSVGRNETALRQALLCMGYDEPWAARPFATLYSRRLFVPHEGGYTVEMFLDPLGFHHEIRLGSRLTMDELTLTLADLVLSKLQFADLPRKHLIDLTTLLGEHSVVAAGMTGIDRQRISTLCSNDWELWHTITLNLQCLQEFVASDVPEGAFGRKRALQGIELLRQQLETSKKTARWYIRQIADSATRGRLPIGAPVENLVNDRWQNWR